MLAKTPLHEIIDRSTLAPWRKLLLDSADYISSYGHTKGQLEDLKTGAVCLRGAIYKSCDYWSAQGIDADNHFNRWLVDTGRQKSSFGGNEFSGDELVTWNNKPERTGQEVIDAMRACALQNIL